MAEEMFSFAELREAVAPAKRRTVKATTILPLALALACAAADYPEVQISNDVLQVKLLLPDAHNGYYRGTRFDWSGAISSLQFQGSEYFGKWFDQYDPKIHDAIMGPVEEFLTNGMGLGYEEAKPGQSFVKSGSARFVNPRSPPSASLAPTISRTTGNGPSTRPPASWSSRRNSPIPSGTLTSIRRPFGWCRVSRRWCWSTACGIPARSRSRPAFTSTISTCWTTGPQAQVTSCVFRSRSIRRPTCMGWRKREARILRT